jgi:hypothetical protein
MTNATDPQGISAERVRLNARLVILAGKIAAYTSTSGDLNTLKDHMSLQQQCYDRLNLGIQDSTTYGPGLNQTTYNAFGTALAGFGIGAVST